MPYELGVIRRFLTEAESCGLVFSGEAGIRKTRLACVAEAYARERGLAVLRAKCFETERFIPYGALVGLPHNLFREGSSRDPLQQPA